jgi:hypothetical protein
MPKRDVDQPEYLNDKDAAEERENSKDEKGSANSDEQRRKEAVESSLIGDAFGH